MFVFVLGSIDFLFAFYQWNAATKAVQMGVRIAAVSEPVARGLNGLSAGVVSASLRPGSAMPSFTVTCDGGRATCTCEGACKGVGGYNDAAMRTIVFGRGSTACGDATSLTPPECATSLARLHRPMFGSSIHSRPHQRGSVLQAVRAALCPRLGSRCRTCRSGSSFLEVSWASAIFKFRVQQQR